MHQNSTPSYISFIMWGDSIQRCDRQLYTNLHSTQHMTLVWSSSINCNVFCIIFLCTLRGSALLVFYNKQLLPSIIYLSDLHSLHRCLGYISPPVEIGDGGGHQPVGLNAGIVYNSDPTSRISNYILICIQPNIWRLSGEYISTFQSAEISASISAKCLSAINLFI